MNKKKKIIGVVILILILIASLVLIIMKTKKENVGAINFYIKDQNETPIAGAEAKLVNEKDEEIATVESSVEGKVRFVNVPIGKYKVLINSVPKGYEIDETEKELEVKKLEDTDVTLKAKRVRATVIICNVDQDEKPLEKVKYNIINDEGEVIQEIYTNGEGLAGVTDLPLGTYRYEQKEVPEGYELDSGIYEFKLETDEQVLRVDITTNKK